MLDRPAAIAAARTVLSNAPVFDEKDGGDGQPVVKLGTLVDEILAAANPDALVVPEYDTVGAPSARYPLLYAKRNEKDLPSGAFLQIMAREKAMSYGGVVEVGMVEIVLTLADDKENTNVMVRADAAWHLGLAFLAASIEAARLRGEKG